MNHKLTPITNEQAFNEYNRLRAVASECNEAVLAALSANNADNPTGKQILRDRRMFRSMAEAECEMFHERYCQAITWHVDSLDRWVPACGGLEIWTTYRDGREYSYCWNPGTKKHGWLDRNDIVHESLPACCLV